MKLHPYFKMFLVNLTLGLYAMVITSIIQDLIRAHLAPAVRVILIVIG